MNLHDISKEYFNLFVKNPKCLDLFLMHRNTLNLSNNIAKLAELDNQQESDLSV